MKTKNENQEYKSQFLSQSGKIAAILVLVGHSFAVEALSLQKNTLTDDAFSMNSDGPSIADYDWNEGLNERLMTKGEVELEDQFMSEFSHEKAKPRKKKPAIETIVKTETIKKEVSKIKWSVSGNLHLPAVDKKGLMQHQKELVGKGPSKKIAEVINKVSPTKISRIIYEVVKNRLPKKFERKAASVAKALVEAASKNDMDPFFLIAVIQQESSFNPAAVGSVGEIGLMQIRPHIGAWMGEKLGIKNLDLKDPVQNIKIGAALFEKLRENFRNSSSYYISAYNMGAAKVRSQLNQNKTPREYAGKVMKHYLAMYTTIAEL